MKKKINIIKILKIIGIVITFPVSLPILAYMYLYSKTDIITGKLEKYNFLGIFFPFLILTMYCVIPLILYHIMPIRSTEEELIFDIIIVSILAFTLFPVIILVYKIGQDYNKGLLSSRKLFAKLAYAIVSIAIIYSIIYYIVFDSGTGLFSGVEGKGLVSQLIDFLFYSIGVLTTNSISNIKPLGILPKIITMTQMIFSLVIIVLVIGHLGVIGKGDDKKDGDTDDEKEDKEDNKLPL